VINFDSIRALRDVITTFRFPTPAQAATNRITSAPADGNVLAAGGLLSVLKGQNEIFFFDVFNPNRPRFLSVANPPLSAITDEFQALPDGGFLVR